MNKVYKLIWSKTKNMYVAVAEIAKSHSKSKRSTVIGGVKGLRAGLAAVVVASHLLLPFMASPVEAGTFDRNHSIPVGDYNFLQQNSVFYEISLNRKMISDLASSGAISNGSALIFDSGNTGVGFQGGGFIAVDNNGNANVYLSANYNVGSETINDGVYKLSDSDLAAINAKLGYDFVAQVTSSGSGMTADEVLDAINGKDITPASVTTTGDIKAGGDLEAAGDAKVDGDL
ncbi:MAG: ESPR domain-containing protein, partial [Acidaminococcaceae bacterium]|nr:ESPR domain-containing protein [Acidaminococcaceae bacterium]